MTDRADPIDRLRGDQFGPLWSAVRRRIENTGGLGLGVSKLTLRGLGGRDRDAICGLLGQRWHGADSITIDLLGLDAQLRRSIGLGLIDIVESVGGPLVDHRRRRLDESDAKASGWARATGHRTIDTHPALREWLDGLRRTGRLLRLDRVDPFGLLISALDTVAAIDGWTDPPVQLAVLAVRCTNDAHGLDTDRPLGVLATEAIERITGATGRRAAWRAIGVELDGVSSSALTLAVRGHPLMDLAADLGEPIRVTWRMLDAFVPHLTDLWVCENPVVLDATASSLGASSRPLLCTEGMPVGVVWRMMDIVHRSGTTLHVHADFDIGGLRIAGAIIERFGAEPWRFDEAAYRSATAERFTAIVGAVPVTRWDLGLGTAVGQLRRAVHEEALLEQLIGDLRASKPEQADLHRRTL